MNAYELADELDRIVKVSMPLHYITESSKMLRQQADRIAELEKTIQDGIQAFGKVQDQMLDNKFAFPRWSKEKEMFDSWVSHEKQSAEPVAWIKKDTLIFLGNYEFGSITIQVQKQKDNEFDIPLYTTLQIKELSDGCGNCHACLVGVMENNMPVTSQRMIVCSDCGNKRCPKASNHRHKCTGSNEVGQHGSIYTAPRELSDEEILNVAFCCEVNTVAIENDWDGTVIEFAKAILKKASEK
jgi:hypothetical protein